MFVEALVLAIGDSEVRRERKEVDGDPEALGQADDAFLERQHDRSLAVAKTIDPPWDVVICGDYLGAIENAARKSLKGRTSLRWQVGLAIFGGVRGSGPAALVRELGHAASWAARFDPRWRRRD